jgi:hypothetical protein
MAINHKKVLLIRNSNAAFAELSQQVSDWYATARGLTDSGPTDYYWVSFDFGDCTKSLTTKETVALKSLTTSSHQVVNSQTSPTLCTAVSPKIASGKVGLELIQALKEIILENKIEAVFSLPGVTSIITNVIVSYFYTYWSELMFASSARIFASNYNPVSGNYTRRLTNITGKLTTTGNTSGATRPAAAAPLSSKALAADLPAWGRVGWAQSTRLGILFSSLSEVQTIVNNAIQVEKENNKTKPHVIGGSAYIWGGGVWESIAANLAARDFGLNTYYILDDGTFRIPGNPASGNVLAGIGTDEDNRWAAKSAWYGTPSVKPYVGTQGDFSIQGLDGGKVTVFAASCPRLYAFIPGMFTGDGNSIRATTEYQDRLGFEPGGWIYSWGSGAGWPAEFCLRNGGSLGIGVAGEPGAHNIADADVILVNLLRGMCGAEAVYKGTFNATNTGLLPLQFTNGGVISAHGDPLYRPYASTAPLISESF